MRKNGLKKILDIIVGAHSIFFYQNYKMNQPAIPQETNFHF